MAQTETSPGFRLPWGAERTETDPPADVAPASAPEASDQNPVEELVTPDMIDMKAPATAAARRPTKFMADLSRAMQAAAESSRDETMARLSAEAKTVVEEIHAASTEEAASLRRRADDDVAAVREWSKAEIARIREETEARIATRKTALDGEMEAHAHVVEARVQQVAATVADYEAQMAEFFQRLLAEEDPTRIATMAETMPEPPDLANIAASIAEPQVEPFDPGAARLALIPDAAAPEAGEAAARGRRRRPRLRGRRGRGARLHRRRRGRRRGGCRICRRDRDRRIGQRRGHAGRGRRRGRTRGRGERRRQRPCRQRRRGRRVPCPVRGACRRRDGQQRASRDPGRRARPRQRRQHRHLQAQPGPQPGRRWPSASPPVPTASSSSRSPTRRGSRCVDAITALPGFEARVTGESDGGIDVTAHDPDGD